MFISIIQKVVAALIATLIVSYVIALTIDNLDYMFGFAIVIGAFNFFIGIPASFIIERLTRNKSLQSLYYSLAGLICGVYIFFIFTSPKPTSWIEVMSGFVWGLTAILAAIIYFGILTVVSRYIIKSTV